MTQMNEDAETIILTKYLDRGIMIVLFAMMLIIGSSLVFLIHHFLQ